MDLNFVLEGMSQLFLALLIAVLLFPLEKMFPAVASRRVRKGRVTAILLIAVASSLTMLGFIAYGQMDYIRFLLSFQLVNVSRADVPDWVLFVGSLLFIDLVGYAIHYISHKFMPFWRLHSVHHSDEHVTAVSALLQHPLGTLLGAGIQLFVAVLLGLPLLVFILYGFIAVIHGVFAHADMRLPAPIDRVLRWVIVTPDLHRTHHSIDMQEGNSNFGIVFTFWDRLFGTYVEQPKTGVRDLVMGLPSSESPQRFTATALFLHPFRRRD